MLKWLFIICVPLTSFSQTLTGEKLGFSIGGILTIGTHVNSIGISLNGYYTDHFYQFNGGTTFRFNINSYGKRKKFIENKNTIGLVLLAGKESSPIDRELDGLFHNTANDYGLAYNYIWYFDNAGTSQRSGGWGLHIKNFSVLFENDVFGGQAKDRFRSGHLAFQYRTNDFKFQSGLYIWTGETANSFWQKIPMEKAPSGFRILEDLPYGNTSHGILYGGVRYMLPYGQSVGARIGIDSENIRHAFQNRLIHDLIFLPEKVERNTPHYPRLDENGCPVFDKKDVRRDRLYLLLDANENWSN